MPSLFVLLLLISICQFCRILAVIDCLSCASPVLHDQWQATGLPAMPSTADRFSFHSACDGISGDYKPCADLCMEMLVVSGNEYGVVRGCMSDFYPTGHSLPTLNANKCYFGEYPYKNVTIYDMAQQEAKTYSRPYVGVHFCSSTEKGELACNNKLVASKELVQGGGAFAEPICQQTQQMPTSDCLSCSRYDSSTGCNSNWQQTCPGQWCTKTTGYVNGRWMESRGCATLNPSAAPCVKLESEHIFDLLDNHPLQMPYSLERCYCHGTRCNGALTHSPAGTMGSIWPLFAALLIESLLVQRWRCV